ncbi:hypothetical protein B0H10DRAFT_2215741 [Mycena sp. CBHHK59/15]|nr:hypothetical protein B0H10DRAFT_2215741 [Mycena sp. CBHHK59/15]
MLDVSGTKLGKQIPEDCTWAGTGMVFELKYETDIFDEHGEIKKSEKAKNTVVQLAKSARSILIASSSCFIFVVVVFAHTKACILRFDRAGVKASSAFDWVKESNIFPTFLWHLYNPKDAAGRMYGEDDTSSFPTDEEKTRPPLLQWVDA